MARIILSDLPQKWILRLRRFLLLGWVLFNTIGTSSLAQGSFYKGITVAAPEKPFQAQPLQTIQSLGATSVAIIPFGFIRPGNHKVEFNLTPWQWWGETVEGVEETIRRAHKAGLSVLLKPQIYIPGDWIGSYRPGNAKEWNEFIQSYRNYILTFLHLAEKYGVEMVCLGTEMKSILKSDEEWFEKLICDAREMYQGKLTYAANWDEYQSISFWDRLDYLGINAYFPLCETNCLWDSITQELEQSSQLWQKDILFTEYGYLSVEDCLEPTWELEKQIHQKKVDEECQKMALEQVWTSLGNKEWWAGGFIWKWFPEGMGHEGYVDKDYTPQGKLAEESLRQFFQSTNRK